MHITCPKCNTKFIASPAQIGNLARKVKCSQCGNVWQLGQQDSKTPSALLSQPPYGNKSTAESGVNLPALVPIKMPQYLYIMPFVLISLIIIVATMLLQDSAYIKSIFAIPKLTIDDVHLEYQQDLTNLTVSYRVVNFTHTNIKMPLVRIRLFDNNNRVVNTTQIDQRNITLTPNQYANFKTEFADVAATIKAVDITLGNKLDFILK